MAKKVIWIGSNPEKCDICKNLFGDKFVDGKTMFGPWGCLCLDCHDNYGFGLGMGKGQLYKKQDDGKWLKIDG